MSRPTCIQNITSWWTDLPGNLPKPPPWLFSSDVSTPMGSWGLWARTAPPTCVPGNLYFHLYVGHHRWMAGRVESPTRKEQSARGSRLLLHWPHAYSMTVNHKAWRPRTARKVAFSTHISLCVLTQAIMGLIYINQYLYITPLPTPALKYPFLWHR